MRITEITDLKQIYDYQRRLCAPYFFTVDFQAWKDSFENDTDGAGRDLFCRSFGKAAYDGSALVGFIQYGATAFGFDDRGEISADVSYAVIRALYFDRGREDAGRLLLNEAMKEFSSAQRVYAFFHYFGMSCYARHGKLFEDFGWIRDLLSGYGFVTEHENVYYSALLGNEAGKSVELTAQPLTAGDQQTIDFKRGGQWIGCCEVHYLSTGSDAYLRWIYMDDNLQNQGVGSKCMAALKKWLYDRGITRLDTDTALDNDRARHYYEKNGFIRKGITRSFFTDRQLADPDQ